MLMTAAGPVCARERAFLSCARGRAFLSAFDTCLRVSVTCFRVSVTRDCNNQHLTGEYTRASAHLHSTLLTATMSTSRAE